MKTQNQSMGVKYTVLVSDRNNERKNKKGNIIFDFNCQIDYDVTPNNSYFAKLNKLSEMFNVVAESYEEAIIICATCAEHLISDVYEFQDRRFSPN